MTVQILTDVDLTDEDRFAAQQHRGWLIGAPASVSLVATLPHAGRCIIGRDGTVMRDNTNPINALRRPWAPRVPADAPIKTATTKRTDDRGSRHGDLGKGLDDTDPIL